MGGREREVGGDREREGGGGRGRREWRKTADMLSITEAVCVWTAKDMIALFSFCPTHLSIRFE
mgnify:CR=1 FL=1